MMAAKQHGNDVEIQQLAPQHVLSIRTTIQTADLGAAMGDRTQALANYLQQHAVQPTGAPFVRYHTFNQIETDVEFGVPVAEPITGEGRIAASRLPGGPAITTCHIGPHDQLGEAYARIATSMKEHGHEPAGGAWEIYEWLDLDQVGVSGLPDAAGWRTQLVQPIK